MAPHGPRVGDLRVWYVRNVPGEIERFGVGSPEEAIAKIDGLAYRDLADPAVEWNAMGLEVYTGEDHGQPEADGWEEWYDDVEDNDIDEYAEKLLNAALEDDETVWTVVAADAWTNRVGPGDYSGTLREVAGALAGTDAEAVSLRPGSSDDPERAFAERILAASYGDGEVSFGGRAFAVAHEPVTAVGGARKPGARVGEVVTFTDGTEWRVEEVRDGCVLIANVGSPAAGAVTKLTAEDFDKVVAGHEPSTAFGEPGAVAGTPDGTAALTCNGEPAPSVLPVSLAAEAVEMLLEHGEDDVLGEVHSALRKASDGGPAEMSPAQAEELAAVMHELAGEAADNQGTWMGVQEGEWRAAGDAVTAWAAAPVTDPGL